MSFNEQNSVEHFIINKLAGVKLNNVKTSGVVREQDTSYGSARWKYVRQAC